MPASLAELMAGRRSVTVTLYGHDITAYYRPGYLTPKTSAKIQRLTADEGGDEASMQTFIGLVESWDLLGEDKKPIPLTREALEGIPWLVLNAVSTKCYEDMQPGKRK
jgi:hypothetical protein